MGPRFNVHIEISVREYEAGARRLERSTDAVTSKTQAAERQSERWNRVLKRLRTTALAVGLSLAAIGQQAAATAVRFDDSVTSIETLVGVARQQVKAWRQDLLDLGPAVGRLPSELSKSLFVVTSAGERGGEALHIVEQAGKAAAVGLGETAEIARTVTAALQAYGPANLSAAQATDTLVATVREGNLEAADLAASLGRVLGIAAQLGVTFGQVGGFVATFTRLGVDSFEAVTALSGALVTLLSPAQQSIDTLATVGLTVDALRRSIRERGLAVTLVDLVKAFEGNEEALADIIPNVRALAGVLGTAGAQAEAFLAIEQQVIDSTGILAEAFNIVQDTPGQALRGLRAEIERLAILLGDPLARGLTEALGGLRELAQNTEALERLGRQAGVVLGHVLDGLVLMAKHAKAVQVGLLALMSIGFIAWMKRLAATVAATEAWTGLVGAVAAVRAGFGKLVALNLAQIMAGWAASAAAWAVALGPVVLIATTLALTWSGVAGAIETESRKIEANLARLVKGSEELRASWEQTEAAIASANFAATEGELDRLSRQLGDTLSEMASLRAEMSEVSETGILRGQVVNVAQALAQLDAEYQAASNASRRFEVDIARVQQRLTALSSVEGVQQLISDYTTQLEDTRQRKAELATEIERLEERLSRLNPQVAAHVQRHQELQEKLADARRQMGESKGQATQYEAALASLRARLQELNGTQADTGISAGALATSLEAIAENAEQLAGLKDRLDLLSGITRDSEELLALMDAWSKRNQGIVSDWAVIREAIARGLDPVRDLDDETRGFLETLLQIRAEWAGVQEATRDATSEGLAFLESLAQLGISLEELPKKALSLERALAESRLESLVLNESFQRLLTDMGLSVEELRLRLEEVFNQEEAKLEVELILDSETFQEDLDAQIDDLVSDWLDKQETFWGSMKRHLEEHGQDWLSLGDTLAGIFDSIDARLGEVIASATQTFEAFQQLAATGGGVSGAVAGAQFGGSFANFGQSVGLFEGDRGRGRYGGRLSGDYSDLGATIGGLVGGAFGPVGGVIGSVLGGLIGGAINRGADEGLAELTQIGRDVAVRITRNEGGLGEVLQSLGDAFADTLNGLEDLIGSEIEIGSIGLKLRDDVFRVFANGLTGEFEELEDALNFAVLEALKSASFGEISDQVRAALQNTTAQTLEELFRDLQLAVNIEQMGLPEFQREMRRSAEEMAALAEEARRLQIPLDNLFQFWADGLEDTRDRILGIQESEEERLIAQAEAFNEERARLLEDYEAQLTALTESLAQLQLAQQADVAFGDLADVAIGHLARSGAFTEEALAELATSIAAMGGVAGASADEIRRRIEEIRGFLAALPEAITQADIQEALERQNRQRRPVTPRPTSRPDPEPGPDQIDAWNRAFTQLQRRFDGVSEAALDMVERLDEMREWLDLGRELGIAEERLAEARQAQLELLEREILADAEETIRRASETDFETSIRHLFERFEESFQEAYVLAAERAAGSGEDLEVFFRPLKDVLDEALALEFAEQLEAEIQRLSEAGDLEGLQELIAFLDGLAEADLPPGVQEALQDILASLPDIGAVIAELEAQAVAVADAERAAAEAERRRQQQALAAELDAEIAAFAASAGVVAPVNVRLAELHARLADLELRALGTSNSLTGLEDRLARIEAAGWQATRAIGIDFLQSLEAVGIEIPGLSVRMLELQRAMKLAELAALATEPAFLELLEEMGLSLEELTQTITQGFDEAIAAAEALTDASEDLEESANHAASAIRSIPNIAGGGSTFVERQADRQSEFDRLLAQLQGTQISGFADELQNLLDIAERMRELQAHLGNFDLDQIAQLEADAISALLDRTLAPFERSGQGFRERLEEINTLFETLIDNAEHYPQELDRILAAQQAAIQSVMDEVNAGLVDLRDQLLGIEAPGLTAQQRLDLAQQQVDDLLSRVAEGDLEAQAQLGAALHDLLNATAEVHGTVGPAFAAMQSYILSIIDQVLGGSFQIPLPDDREPRPGGRKPRPDDIFPTGRTSPFPISGAQAPLDEALRKEPKVSVTVDHQETDKELRGLRRDVRDLTRRLDALLVVGREGNAQTRAFLRGTPVERKLL